MGRRGGLAAGEAPRMCTISGLKHVRQQHFGRYHVHGSNHEGRLFFGIWSLVFPVLMSVKDLVVGWASYVLVFASGCVALLCL